MEKQLVDDDFSLEKYLPIEIVVKIVKYLRIKHLFRLRTINKYHHEFFSLDIFWKPIYRAKYNHLSNVPFITYNFMIKNKKLFDDMIYDCNIVKLNQIIKFETTHLSCVIKSISKDINMFRDQKSFQIMMNNMKEIFQNQLNEIFENTENKFLKYHVLSDIGLIFPQENRRNIPCLRKFANKHVEMNNLKSIVNHKWLTAKWKCYQYDGPTKFRTTFRMKLPSRYIDSKCHKLIMHEFIKYLLKKYKGCHFESDGVMNQNKLIVANYRKHISSNVNEILDVRKYKIIIFQDRKARLLEKPDPRMNEIEKIQETDYVTIVAPLDN